MKRGGKVVWTKGGASLDSPSQRKNMLRCAFSLQTQCSSRSCRSWKQFCRRDHFKFCCLPPGKSVWVFKGKIHESIWKNSTKIASIKSHLLPLSGLTIKTEYNLSEESSCSPTMVETSSPLLRTRVNNSPTSNPRLSPQSQNFINSKMLISSQNLSFFEQRLNRNGLSDQKKSENVNSTERHLNGNSSATSLFTIDSILAKQTRYSDMSSPSSSPSHENSVFKNGLAETSPSRSTRLPSASLFQHHPGLHITHLASNFGSPEFLGEFSPGDFLRFHIKSKAPSHFSSTKIHPRGIEMFKNIFICIFVLPRGITHGWISIFLRTRQIIFGLLVLKNVLSVRGLGEFCWCDLHLWRRKGFPVMLFDVL